MLSYPIALEDDDGCPPDTQHRDHGHLRLWRVRGRHPQDGHFFATAPHRHVRLLQAPPPLDVQPQTQRVHANQALEPTVAVGTHDGLDPRKPDDIVDEHRHDS